ncbi:MAG: RnfABCDGE type electron transport complex subunit D [Clostridia bacterium]|nr:RnfABCDGE type electron transport complex subunit D [Clostridia bacterium]
MSKRSIKNAPFIHGGVGASAIMRDVIIALIPALIWSVYIFGFRALTITVLSVASTVLTELIFCKATKKESTVSDLSAVVTGLILAFCLPVTAPLWMPILGGAFAIGVVKMPFGGLGKNFLNPALAGKAFLLLSFPKVFSGYASPATARGLSPFAISVKAKLVPSLLGAVEDGVDNNTLVDMFYGNMAGCIGEVSKLCIILGLLYLLIRRVISWQIPVAYLSVFFILAFSFPRGMDEAMNFAIASLLCGSVAFASVFVATDPVTSPMTSVGKIIYGVLCGGLTLLFRYFGSAEEGAVYAILVANTLVFYIDKLTCPKKSGGVKIGN